MENTPQPKSVLLVEDDLDIIDSFQEIISSWGYEVLTASSYDIALEKLQSKTYDVIVLDVQLGNVSGFRVVDFVRRTKPSLNADTPIILHSGNLDVATMDSYQSDVNAALIKPVTLARLKEKLDHWSQHRHSGISP